MMFSQFLNSNESRRALFSKALNASQKAQKIASAIIQRIKNPYPQQYLSLVVRSQALTITVFENFQAVEQKKINFQENDTQELADYFGRYETYPLQLIIQGGETDFRLVSLKHVKWWDRPAVIKQIRIGEFIQADWTQKFFIPTSTEKARYLVAGVRPTPTLKKIIAFLSQQPHAIAGVHLWPILCAQRISDYLYDDSLSYKWTLIAQVQPDHFWNLVVCQNNAVVMYRHGYFDNPLQAAQELSKEVIATLRYLHRNGYQEGEGINLVESGVSTIALPEDIEVHRLTLPQPLMPTQPFLKPLSFKNLLQKLDVFFFQNHETDRPSIRLPLFQLKRLAYFLPQILVRVCMPLNAALVGISILYHVKAVSQEGLRSDLHGQVAQQVAKIKNTDHLTSALLFHYFSTQESSKNPLKVLKILGRAQENSFVAKEILWTSAKNGEQLFTLTLLPMDASAKKNKPSIEAYFQRVEKFLQQQDKNMHITWQTVTGKQNVYSLQIQAEEKSCC